MFFLAHSLHCVLLTIVVECHHNRHADLDHNANARAFLSAAPCLKLLR
jgi:hypothetical protein